MHVKQPVGCSLGALSPIWRSCAGGPARWAGGLWRNQHGRITLSYTYLISQSISHSFITMCSSIMFLIKIQAQRLSEDISDPWHLKFAFTISLQNIFISHCIHLNWPVSECTFCCCLHVCFNQCKHTSMVIRCLPYYISTSTVPHTSLHRFNQDIKHAGV